MSSVSRVFLTAFFLFLFCFLSCSLVLAVAPDPETALWWDWRFAGFSREKLEVFYLAAFVGLVFSGGGVLGLERKRVFSSIRAKGFFGKEIGMAGFLVALFLGATQVSPEMEPLLAKGKQSLLPVFALSGPPLEKASDLPLADLCRKTNLDTEIAIRILAGTGFSGVTPKATLLSISRRNDMAPYVLFSMMQGAFRPPLPDPPSSANGGACVAAIANEYGVAPEVADALLHALARHLQTQKGTLPSVVQAVTRKIPPGMLH